MPNPNHHVCVHGHFYQPPRDNPWLGRIERQPSAAPFHDWNERIASECYRALCRSRLRDADGRIEDLYNNFAHMSFNIGPTLFAWLERHHPDLVEQIRTGERLGRDRRHGRGSALAQPYNHMILPLCDAQDRHTQILWGLHEYRHRFGCDPDGLWLPECAIDMNTIRALITHGIRFVILSPRQAAWIRPFGASAWTDVSGGAIDTRYPYRVFEVDGAGRTHFHRSLDVIFFEPELGLKVSFENLLHDPERFRNLMLSKFDADATLPQLVTLVTDGEVYGHHQKGGDETLTRFFAHLAPQEALYVSSLSEYLDHYPPCWEVKLWMGEDGKGSSWSCEHGIGRWWRDCGCHTGGPPDWTQAWRTPLRHALDHLRWEIKTVFEREAAALLRDPWEARDAYIEILLDRSDASRWHFLERHAARVLTDNETVRVWRLFEAAKHAMFMYTSCGWFFNDLAGIEPMQNLRYALRAIELIQPYAERDLARLLEDDLAGAVSNAPHHPTGADLFRRAVFPSRHPPARRVAAAALLHLAGHAPEAGVRASLSHCETDAQAKTLRATGQFVDPETTETHTFAVFAALRSVECVGAVVVTPDRADTLAALATLADEALAATFAQEGHDLAALPAEDREAVLASLQQDALDTAGAHLRDLCAELHPLLATWRRLDAPPPPFLEAVVTQGAETNAVEVMQRLRASAPFDPALASRLCALLAEADGLGLDLSRDRLSRIAGAAVLDRLRALPSPPDAASLKDLLAWLTLRDDAGLSFDSHPEIQDAYWQRLREDAPPADAPARDAWTRLGTCLGFAPQPNR